MKTKILVLLLTAITIASTSKAQNNEKTTFGIHAGMNFQNITGKNSDGADEDYSIKTGFHIGVNAEVPVASDFYLQPGLLFSTKGAKWDVRNSSEATKYNISYLEIPVNFLYKPALGTGKLILGVGPYVALGIGGKVKHSGDTDLDVKFKNELSESDFDPAVYYVKRLDAGGNLLFGYEFSNKISVQLNGQLGLVNISPKIKGALVEDKTSHKNTGFGFSVGYRF